MALKHRHNRRSKDGEAPGATAGVPAVGRALDVIEYLADHGRPFGINELARELGFPVNSVFRILKCLEARGYVETEGPGGGYQLSTRFFSLGMRLYTRFDLRRRARPHLETLCRQTGETTQIYVFDAESAMVLDCVTPEAAWFPAPRRTGGGLAAALAVLEEVVFRCLAAGWPFDNPRGRW